MIKAKTNGNKTLQPTFILLFLTTLSVKQPSASVKPVINHGSNLINFCVAICFFFFTYNLWPECEELQTYQIIYSLNLAVMLRVDKALLCWTH